MAAQEAGPAVRGRGSWRDRLLADRRVQRWALAFPPTRWVARRRARRLFDLCAGFVYSQVLLACVRLGLFAILAEGPQVLGDLARRLDLPAEATRRLLDAAASLDLVSRRGGDRYALGPLAVVLPGDPGLQAMIEHHALLYADLADPVAVLRGAGPRALAGYWAYAGAAAPSDLDAADVAPYSALMGASQAMVSAEILDAFDLGSTCHVLDIGGGDGSFLTAVAARAPAARLTLFDLPAVAAVARSRLTRAGLADRVAIVEGDFRAEPLPRGADLATFIRVLHDHDDAVVLDLLRAARAALAPGGTVLVAEPMANTPGARPVGHAYFGFYLLAMGSGRPRSAAEIGRLLTTAGFDAVTSVPTRLPLVASLLTARA